MATPAGVGEGGARVSIADIAEERLGGERGPERTPPPHDLMAEQSTLGGMLLSKDAVADVIESLRGSDFYIPQARADLRRDPLAVLAWRAH